MHDKSDARLLREYADHGDQAAFREIVTRHTDVVYSSALRQVGSPDLARDVAQSVFTDLARKAPSLARTLAANASLLGWLHRGTRFAALNQLRDDRRRQARERNAMQNLDPASNTPPEWDRIQPVLDEAMSELSDEDREALLLRFFQKRDFRAIGQSLGVSDDAAQKRVSRALDKLRGRLTSRGVTATAAALATTISANAVTAAPTGLAVTLSTTALAGTAIATTATATATATKAIAMTTLQKTVIGATLAAAIGAGVYEARQASELSDQNRLLEQQQSTLEEQVRQLNRERDADAEAMANLRAENARLNRNIEDLPRLRGELARLRAASEELAALQAAQTASEQDATALAAKSWLTRVKQLRRHLTQTPDAAIPEFALLNEEDWLDVARADFESSEDYREAMSRLRGAAERKAGKKLQAAFGKFLESNNGEFPPDVSQLRPYLNEPLDDSILRRWEIAPAERVSDVGVGSEWILTQKSPVDEEHDMQFVFGPTGGWGSTHFKSQQPELEALETTIKTLQPVVDAYSAANGGREPNHVADLLPYLRTPEQQSAYNKVLRNTKAAQESGHE